MLDTLAIKNFAIIEDIEVNFHSGMNVLLGETGAGKSIIIEALSLLKGERSSFEKIRAGASKAFIEGRFLLDNQELIAALNEEYDGLIEDNELIVARTLDVTGRTSIRLNGRMFSTASTKAIMTEIIDIHSQHENLLLLDEHNHLPLLDKYIGDHPLFTQYNEMYVQYKIEKEKLDDLTAKIINEEEIAYKRTQIDEIEMMDMQVGELDKLEMMQKKMSNFIRLQTAVNNVDELLEGDDGANGKIYQARREIDGLADEEYEALSNRLNDTFYEIQEINGTLKIMLNEINDYEYTADYLNERIYNLKKLIRKYGVSEDDVFEAKKKLSDEILLASDYNYYLKKQEEAVSTAEVNLAKAANELSQLRQDQAHDLEKLVDIQLEDLSLGNAHFQIEFLKDDYRASGNDHVRFLLSANVGTPFLPIKQIISGGESSRLMLGLKTIFTNYSTIETLIFDEVDIGVSGKVASQVGKKIHEISSARQVLVISHLAQVASFGDYAYHVGKIVEQGETKTTIKELDTAKFVEQVASLLSGSEITNSSLSVAKELIESSHK